MPRHPMPDFDLDRERAQRFASMADLDAARSTTAHRRGKHHLCRLDYAEMLAAADRSSGMEATTILRLFG